VLRYKVIREIFVSHPINKVPNGAGTVYPSRAPEFILGFSDLLVA
jgi:hypothetical protein